MAGTIFVVANGTQKGFISLYETQRASIASLTPAQYTAQPKRQGFNLSHIHSKETFSFIITGKPQVAAPKVSRLGFSSPWTTVSQKKCSFHKKVNLP